MNKKLTAIILALISFYSCRGVSPISNEKEIIITNNEVDLAVSHIPLGGDNTLELTSINSFSKPSPKLNFTERTHFFTGESFFDQNWVIAPSSTVARDGLGAFFNARSCATCHVKDGTGKPFDESGDFNSLLIRLSIAGKNPKTGGVNPDPHYGGQLQNFSIPNVKTEGKPVVKYTEISGSYSDGEEYTLQKPSYEIQSLNYGDLSSDIMFSPRIAPKMIGLGLLEDITKEELLKNSDPDDQDNDGISGRPNYVWDVEKQQKEIGRFGWKANQPNVKQQVAGAFLGDIGITTPLFPNEEVTDYQQNIIGEIQNGGKPEVSTKILDRVTLYSRNLAVPAQRSKNKKMTILGNKLFKQISCSACHLTKIKSKNQDISPYTDLLLHDMGDGLSDNRPDFEATGNEWRTPPLWGIGLIEKVNGHTNFLHDGRARNIEEAILWHGGEAEKSTENFKNLAKNEREALIEFINTL